MYERPSGVVCGKHSLNSTNSPFMLRKRERVETELQRLEKEGIISPMKSLKLMGCPYLKNLCGDFKVITNKALLKESYPP